MSTVWITGSISVGVKSVQKKKKKVLTNDSLKRILFFFFKTLAPPKIILSWDAQHTAENLNGCTDWNCKFTLDTTKANVSDAILVTRTYKSFSKFRESTQYVVYFSQVNFFLLIYK